MERADANLRNSAFEQLDCFLLDAIELALRNEDPDLMLVISKRNTFVSSTIDALLSELQAATWPWSSKAS